MLLCKVVVVESDLELRIDLRINGKPYALTVTRTGFQLVRKGKRKGVEMPWTFFAEDDDAMLYSELHAAIRKAVANAD